ncbi:hypothetical protein K7432_007195 [Basidiobolus ranarum]|uniref:Dehydrin n=1 Tax=Basidiobolus ranarum TaxID=34480 RepID=A0ABR2WTW4_9FUNG
MDSHPGHHDQLPQQPHHQQPFYPYTQQPMTTVHTEHHTPATGHAEHNSSTTKHPHLSAIKDTVKTLLGKNQSSDPEAEHQNGKTGPE